MIRVWDKESNTFCYENILEDYGMKNKIIQRYVGFSDKNDCLVYEGDILRLDLPSGEIRYFVARIKTVTRKVVNHPTFVEKLSKVSISGTVLCWKGYDLFPCVDEQGVPDNKRMEIVGNEFENPDLLEKALC